LKYKGPNLKGLKDEMISCSNINIDSFQCWSSKIHKGSNEPPIERLILIINQSKIYKQLQEVSMSTFHTYSLNLVKMNKLVELKGNDKLKMQNDKNYAIFGRQIKLWNINSWKFYLWPSFLSKFGSKHHFGQQISINIGIYIIQFP
jgi:hypothetical protein